MNKKMMNCLVILAFLCCLALSQAQRQGRVRTQGASDVKGKNRLSPQIRKCLDVSCDPGFFCFHGRCKKIDYECLNKKCEKGQRCNKGACVKQLHKPQKQVCSPLGLELTKMRCTEQLRAKCLVSKSSIKVCGYFPNRTHQDFDNQCSACSQGSQVRFYYQATCKWAPRICRENEECLNGACTVIFNEAIFENYRTCNSNKDCKAHERCGGHKCIDRRDMFNYLQSKAEINQIGLSV